ncbi:PP2C family protein-serine/threonine phosphatase [Edaphobacter aggregans]|uniref:PP2C family protein-serine/threonine phosphatase n=1 Tax=Edaphobacter aggregans TaxID=570835 RepID=UPI00068AE03B|nr:SpoIIE family protein phosphatase [Edaphobacter aggregans]
MGKPPSDHHAHRCSFHPDRRDPYLRLNTVTVFVRDQERSLRFFVDQLGFNLAYDFCLPSGDRWLAVSPPDGTAMISLAVPDPSAEECRLIGRATQISFLTENISAKFEEWRERGVHFQGVPQSQLGGGISVTFEDVDHNSFTLLCLDEMTQEIESERLAHAERHALEQRTILELEVARQTQARLFPQTPPSLKSLDCEAACFQARAVGGDYFDFLDLGREHMGLVIGDISGKGTAAALLMANLQAHLRNLCPTYWNRPYVPFVKEQPARFLQTVNRLFYENTRGNAYSTLFFGEFDDSTRRLRYSNCGHPSALLLQSDGHLQRLDSTCTVLGLFNGWDGDVGECQLSSGDTLALYTDGVIEAFNDAGEEFGEQRLVEALQQYRELPTPALLASVADEVRQFSPQEQTDDFTLIVAKCR